MKSKFEFDTFVVRSQFLAGMLMLFGHKLIAIAKDNNDETRNVFYFTNSESLIRHYEKFDDFKKIINPIINKMR